MLDDLNILIGISNDCMAHSFNKWLCLKIILHFQTIFKFIPRNALKEVKRCRHRNTIHDFVFQNLRLTARFFFRWQCISIKRIVFRDAWKKRIAWGEGVKSYFNGNKHNQIYWKLTLSCMEIRHEVVLKNKLQRYVHILFLFLHHI